MASVIKGNKIRQFIKPVKSYATHLVPSAKQQEGDLVGKEVQTHELKNGAIVTSVEKHQPLSTITFTFKAGSRFERPYNRGGSQALRICSLIGSHDQYPVASGRFFQQMGANPFVEQGREHMTFGITCPRDNANIAGAVLGDLVCDPRLRHFDVSDRAKIMRYEGYAKDPSAVLFDNLHSVAFKRMGLGKTMYMPDIIEGKFTYDQILEYHHEVFLPERLSLAGLNVSSGTIMEIATSGFNWHSESGAGPVSEPSTYIGGQSFVDDGGHYCLAAIAGSAASYGTPAVASFDALGKIIENSQSDYKGIELSTPLLSAFKSAGVDNCFGFAFNMAYSDAGLFGFVISGEPWATPKALASSINAIKNLKITENDVNYAKNELRLDFSRMLMCTSSQMEYIGLNALYFRNYEESKMLTHIESVNLESVRAALQGMVKSRPTLSALGHVTEIPPLEELM